MSLRGPSATGLQPPHPTPETNRAQQHRPAPVLPLDGQTNKKSNSKRNPHRLLLPHPRRKEKNLGLRAWTARTPSRPALRLRMRMGPGTGGTRRNRHRRRRKGQLGFFSNLDGATMAAKNVSLKCSKYKNFTTSTCHKKTTCKLPAFLPLHTRTKSQNAAAKTRTSAAGGGDPAKIQTTGGATPSRIQYYYYFGGGEARA